MCTLQLNCMSVRSLFKYHYVGNRIRLFLSGLCIYKLIRIISFEIFLYIWCSSFYSFVQPASFVLRQVLLIISKISPVFWYSLSQERWHQLCILSHFSWFNKLICFYHKLNPVNKIKRFNLVIKLWFSYFSELLLNRLYVLYSLFCMIEW